MNEIELFDGTILSFPEGTSQDVMIRAAREQTAKIRQGQIDQKVQAGANVATDVAKSAGSGLLSGTVGLVEAPNALVGGIGRLAARGAEALGASPEFARGIELGLGGVMPGGGTGEAVDEMTGGAVSFQPETMAGTFAKTASEFVPGAVLTGGGGTAAGMGRAAVQYGILPGLASEAAGQAVKDTTYEPYARFAASLLAPAAAQGVANMVRGIVSPFGSVSPERLKLAKVLDDFGVPISAGQRTGAEKLRRAEAMSSLGGTLRDDQLQAFTRAALKTIGENADTATPEVLERAAQRIGSVFDDVVRGVEIVPEPQSLASMSGALKTFRDLKPSDQIPPLFKNINKAMLDAAMTGKPIPASDMKVWRSTLSKLTRSADDATREAAIAAMDVIDDTISQGLIAAGKPEAVGALKEARAQYRNFLAIETAASRAGEGVAAGILSPSQLRNAVVQQGRRAYVQGRRGDIGNLTRAAEAVMKPLPTVSEGGVRRVSGLGTAASGGLGATIGQGLAGPYGAAAGGALGALLPTAMQEAVASAPVQTYLANQLLGGASRKVTDPRTLSSLTGLLAQ